MPGVLIDGLLLEGLNYSGKTTMARAVEKELAALGAPVSPRHCYLCPDPVVETLHQVSFDRLLGKVGSGFPDPTMLRPVNALRSAQVMIDSQVAAETDWSEVVVVQDRNWLTQMGNNEFFTPGEGFLSPEWVRTNAPRFTVQLYLTCSPAVRQERVTRRPAVESHAMNTYLRANVAQFDIFEEVCLDLVDQMGGFEIVSTDELDVGAVARDIAARVLAERESRIAAEPLPTPSGR